MTINETLWQAEEVVRIVRASCLHEQSWTARGVAVDSRNVSRGDLFIALTDEAHDQIAAAFAAGASAALVSRRPSQSPPHSPLIFVEDTVEALYALALTARNRTRARIIGVTGSVGKSCVKEMLRLSLGAVAHSFAHAGHTDHRIGMLLALANLPPNADYGILEIGLQRPGDIAEMAKLARPDIAVVTSIEPAHLENLASLEAVADAKAEIFQGMAENGIVVLNRDNSYSSRLASAAKARGIKKIMFFGRDGKCDAKLIDCALTREGCAVNAMVMGYNIHYAIGATGLHQVYNSLAVLLAANAASRNIDAYAAALAHYRSPKGRGAIVPLILTVGGILTLIDESGGACPASVGAALSIIGHMIPTAAGRRLLVIGDMDDLGDQAPPLHTRLAAQIEKARIDSVYCCGELTLHLFQALPEQLRGGYAPNSETLAAHMALAVRADDIVLVKGSPAMRMHVIVDALKALDVAQPRKIAS